MSFVMKVEPYSRGGVESAVVEQARGPSFVQRSGSFPAPDAISSICFRFSILKQPLLLS